MTKGRRVNYFEDFERAQTLKRYELDLRSITDTYNRKNQALVEAPRSTVSQLRAWARSKGDHIFGKLFQAFGCCAEGT